MFNLAVDNKHVTLAFGLKWIEKLAQHFDHIDVVTMTAGEYKMPSNITVWSLGRELGYPKWLRFLRFYWCLGKVFCRRRIAVVFTHMIPVFAVLSWPALKLLKLKNVLWYAHGSTPIMLKLAHTLVDEVVSSTPQGFRLDSKKVSFIGQGIDTKIFRIVKRISSQEFRLVTVGRLAPSKGVDILIKALAKWNNSIDWHLTIVGDATSESESNYAKSLRLTVKDLLPPEKVTFTGRLEPRAIASILATSDLFVNMSSTGSLDKSILEAMASGCPVVSSNEAFQSLASAEGFPECAIQRSEENLLTALQKMVSMNESRRKDLGARQSEVVDRGHTLDGLIKQLVEILHSNARSKEAE